MLLNSSGAFTTWYVIPFSAISLFASSVFPSVISPSTAQSFSRKRVWIACSSPSSPTQGPHQVAQMLTMVISCCAKISSEEMTFPSRSVASKRITLPSISPYSLKGT